MTAVLILINLALLICEENLLSGIQWLGRALLSFRIFSELVCKVFERYIGVQKLFKKCKPTVG